jgi:DNA repair exonuclease SbcCD ATPase subunit
MPRGRRRVVDVSTLEEELNALKQRQTELRQQLRRMRNSQGEVKKLEEKLGKQLATARWTAGQIRQVQPEWDEIGFYQSVSARQPTPRGRRRRTPAEA